MMEERRKMSEMKIACIEKGYLANHEYEMARIQLKDNKLEMTRMKMELDMKRSKEEYETEKLRMEKLKDNKMKKLRMNQMKEEKKSMMMDVNTLSSMQQKYIHQCQMKILEKRSSRS